MANKTTCAVGKEYGGSTNRSHEQLSYDYDPAGNLRNRTNNALVQAFNVNMLNELTTITRGTNFTLAGFTTIPATNVTVNGANAARYADNTFAKDNLALVDGPNSFTAVARDSAGRVDTNALNSYLPSTLNIASDANGNMTTNGTRLFEYDDENQLTRITEPGAWMTANVYDGKLRRRIERNHEWRNGAWVQTSETRFVYDGNVILQERDQFNLPRVTLTRGLDLSGSLQGAGGIGGLLALSEMSNAQSPIHSYFHADGNGNVTMLISTNQQMAARYLFDPFGNTLAASGPKALVNRYRFSSKPIHELSGMYDYRYRWYAPELQRWPNRDPLDELGFSLLTTGRQPTPTVDFDDDEPGIDARSQRAKASELNLYAFVENRPTTEIDPFGLFLGFGYGNWCGYSRSGQNGDPIDDVDMACYIHDWCLEKPIDACKFKFCNVRFCRDVAKAKCHGDKACKKAKRKILAGCALIVPIPPFIFM